MQYNFFKDLDASAYAALADDDKNKHVSSPDDTAGIFQVEITGAASLSLYGRVSVDAPWAFVCNLGTSDIVANDTAAEGVRMFPYMRCEAVITSGTVSAWVAN